MKVDLKTGLLEGVRQIPSPNCDERPEGISIDLLIVHGISLPPENFGGPYIDQFFTNQLDPNGHPYFETIATRRVSAHCLIRRDGEVVQYVPFHKRAWHAGSSTFRDREACNDFSIGIELEGADTIPYTSVQYKKLASLINILRKAYPRVGDHPVVGHSDVAPGRKTDPGEAFEWSLLTKLLENPQVFV